MIVYSVKNRVYYSFIIAYIFINKENNFILFILTFSLQTRFWVKKEKFYFENAFKNDNVDEFSY